ncbi:MAG TPA: enoyl-CoA hydratase-related protein [Acetobacteraceae bacterium]|jgi:enoyl-CoA hydratase/carnithine racemase|nr:enoyl-CoA hydratase-related protein [Acetobacteraceae bacterium]
MANEIQVAVDATGVAVVTLNRPEKRNVVSLAMWRGLGEIYRDLGRRSDVRVVILTGAGGHFCGGADISEFARVRNTVEDAHAYGEAGHAATQAIIDLPQPTIAAVHGYGVGGGCGLALACDLRVGDATTQMGIPAARLSIVYSTLDCSLLLRAVGLANAKLVLYSGRYFPLADCRAMGLIDVVAEPGALAGAHTLAQELCTRAPLSQRGAKVVLEALDRGEAEQRAAEIAAVQEAAVNSEDYREARQAFLEKRTPMFNGR